MALSKLLKTMAAVLATSNWSTRRSRPKTAFRGPAELLEARQMLTQFVVDTPYDVVDPADEFTSLREALAAAADETAHPGADTIVFAETLRNATVHADIINAQRDAIVGEGGQFIIDSDVTIDASAVGFVRIGHDRGESRKHRIFKVEPGVTASMTNVFIQGGDSDGEDGAGLWNGGYLTLTEVVIGGNFALTGNPGGDILKGGGIYNAAGATLTLQDSHVGEIGLEDDLIAENGFSASDFEAAEQRELQVFTAQFRGGDIVEKSTSDITILTGNGANGNGGGIYNDGTLHLLNTVVRANRVKGQFTEVSSGDPFGYGAGIFNAGVMTLSDSIVEAHDGFLEDNKSGAFDGAGIFNAASATLTIERSQVRDNVSPTEGVGLYNLGTVTISNSQFSGNRVGGDREIPRGGAIYNRGDVDIFRSSFTDNFAPNDGGAIYNATGGDLLLDHVTAANNVSDYGDGGAVAIAAGSTTTIRHSTIARNVSVRGNGVSNLGTLTLHNSILAENQQQVETIRDRQDLRSTGTLISEDFNLIESLDGSFTTGPLSEDIVGNPTQPEISAHLGLLGNYGGLTQTIPLLPNSRAIDSGAATEIEIDQRGEARQIGSTVDRGAYESAPPTSMRVDTLSDLSDGFYGPGEFSLREAIEWANQLPGTDEIAFDEDFLTELRDAGEPILLELENGPLLINSDITLHGPGVDQLTISGLNDSRVFEIAGGATVTLTDATLTDGYAEWKTGGPRGDGGAIHNAGDLTLRRMRLTANAADNHGGGVYSTGPLFIDSTTIDANIADYDSDSTTAAGGGVHSIGTTTVINSTISGNEAYNGGGLFLSGSEIHHEVRSSTVVLNTAVRGGVGGGIRAWNVSVGNSIVALNASTQSSHEDVSAINPTSLGFNVIGVGTAAFVDGTNDDQVGTTANPIDPLIGRLRTLGNGIPIHGLLPGSPAIEAADPNNFPRFDQRGVARPVDTKPDIGAFEYIDPVYSIDGDAVVVTVDSLDGVADGAYGPGELSLVEAVLFVNSTPQSGNPKPNTIRFAEELFVDGSATIEFDANDRPGALTRRVGLEILSSVDIVGPGADKLTLKSTGAHRVLTVGNATADDVEVSFSGVTMTGGQGGTNGGGIQNFATLNLDGIYVVDNSASEGGGIHNAQDAFLNVDNSTIATNVAVLQGGGFLNEGQAILRNVTFSGNGDHRNEFGGAIRAKADSTTTLIHTTAFDNQANHGGAFFGDSGSTISFSNSIIAGNTGVLSFPDVNTSGATITSHGGNIFGTNSGHGFVQATDQAGTESNPLVPFMTDLVLPATATVPMHALLPTRTGNIAENMAVAANALPTDARGVARPTDEGFEVGAFELADIDRTQFTWESEIVVDRWDDTLDAVYSPGQMTLREALILANAFDGTNQEVINGIAYDIIRFSDELLEDLAQSSEEDRALLLRRGALQIDGNVILDPFYGETDRTKIDRSVVVIDGDAEQRVVQISTSGDAEDVETQLRNLTITNGFSGNESGGGIRSYGDLTLTNVAVTDSRTTMNGGGIAALEGTLTVNKSVIDRNLATGAVGTGGGGIYSQPTVIVDIRYSTISDNSAIGLIGGGIYARGVSGTQKTFFMDSSTVSGNTARHGAGIDLGPSAVIQNSTISGNVADGGGGGGLRISNNNLGQVGAEARILNTTIADNQSSLPGSGFSNSGTAVIGNTIIAGNRYGTGDFVNRQGSSSNLVRSVGHNIFESTDGFESFLGWIPNNSDLIGVDPKIGPLANNGGFTKTHLLKTDSPAIDAGSEEFMPLMDQRGRPMVDIPSDKIPNGGNTIPDIGSYEIQGVSNSAWSYDARDQSQFGPGDALTFGFGFDDGKADSTVRKDPHFLGFEFDTGPLSYGGIEKTAVGSFGGKLNADFSGKFGFDVGFYVNSGSVDVSYDGNVDYVLDVGDDYAGVTAFANVSEGFLQTVSPKVGAYLDLVLELNADVSATGCLFGCVTADLLDIHFSQTSELLAVNRQVIDSKGNPVFSDRDGNGIVRRSNGSFYTLPDEDGNSQNVTDPGPLVPLLSGEINYFGISLGDLNEDEEEKEKSHDDRVRDSLEGRKSAKTYEDAKKERQRAENFSNWIDGELDNAVDRMRNPQSEADAAKAREDVNRLAGKDYADAVSDGKTGSDLPEKRGEVETARNSHANATLKERSAKKEFDAKDRGNSDKDKKKKNDKAEAGNGVVVSFQEAEGNLLGAQANFGLGASAGKFGSAVKNIGSAQVTLPDVNLSDTSITQAGTLGASTDNFPLNSPADNNRQIAKASLDLAALVPVIPGGTYSLSAGPLSLDLTTVSYKLEPQLNVTQDVAATYEAVAGGMVYSFFQPGVNGELGPAIATQVKVNGQLYSNGDAVTSVAFSEGDNVMITGVNYDGNAGNDSIVVTPSIDVRANFRNDIGLEVDLDGAFRAFALRLAAFDIDIVNIRPLLKHDHNLARFDLGDVFNKQFELPTRSVALEAFTLFNQKNDGRTSRAALMTSPTDTLNQASRVVDSVRTGPPVIFFSSDMVDVADSDIYFQTLDVAVTGNGVSVDKLQVLDDRLTVVDNGDDTFTIAGFTEDMILERSSAVFALTFASGEGQQATITTTRRDPVSKSVGVAESTDEITDEDFDIVGVKGVLSNDIDDNGIVDVDTDGVLLIRRLAGFSGAALIDGALGEDAQRTDAAAIAAYIDDLRNAEFLDDDGKAVESLDIDGDNGKASALGDGILLARFMAGVRGNELIQDVIPDDATRTSVSEIETYIQFGQNANTEDSADNIGSALTPEPSEPLVDFSLLGSSPTNAIIGSENPDAERLVFNLTTFGQDFDVVEHFYGTDSTGELASRVPVGSPASFSTDERKELIATRGLVGSQEQPVFEQTVSGVLGLSEPLFIEGPDAAVMQFEALDGAEFEALTLNQRVNGNLYLPTKFDLYLKNPTTGIWGYDRLITDAGPTQQQPDGNVLIEFATPVKEFRLYGHVVANRELHDSRNEVVPEFTLATGFTLSSVTGTPLIQRDVISARISLTETAPISVNQPVFASDQTPVAWNFVAERSLDTLSVTPTSATGSLTATSFGIASTASISIVGNDNVDDTLTISGQGNQISTPINFDGGFRNDSVVLDGSGIVIDLVDRSNQTSKPTFEQELATPLVVTDVEVVDIRGTGANTVLLDADAVLANDPFGQQLVINRDSDDTVSIGSGWNQLAPTTIGSTVYDTFAAGQATLFIQQTAGGNVQAADSSSGSLASVYPEGPQQKTTPTAANRVASAPVVAAADSSPMASVAVTSVNELVDRDGKAEFKITWDPAQAMLQETGLDLKLHYDSSQLHSPTIDHFFAHGYSGFQDRAETVDDDDGDPATDRFLQLLWFDLDADWPGIDVPIGEQLATVQFSPTAGFQQTSISTRTESTAGAKLEDQSTSIEQGTAATLLSPGVRTYVARPTISWQQIDDAVSYEIRISKNGTVVFEASEVTDLFVLPDVDLALGTHQVQVRGIRADGKPHPWNLEPQVQVQTTVEIQSPSAANQLRQPELSWGPIPGAARYEVWVNDSAGLVFRDPNVQTTSITPDKLGIGEHRMWVRGVSDEGETGRWSLVQRFPIGAQPTSLSPALSTFDSTPEFRWDSVEGADSYDLWVRNLTTKQDQVIREQQLTTNHFTPTDAMADGYYRFWVRAKTDRDTIGKWSDGVTFYLGGRADGIGPIGTTSTSRPTFAWSLVSGAVGYDLFVGEVNRSGPVLRQVVTTTSHTAPAELPAGTYRFWVQAIASDGKLGLWSRPLGFVIR